MAASEIANSLIAGAVVQTQGATLADYRIVSSFGVRDIVRLGVGSYNVRMIEPLDYYVNPSPSLVITRARQMVQSTSMGGFSNPAFVGVVPMNVVLPSQFEPGSLAVLFTNASGVPQDVGQVFFQVWQFPTIE